MIIQETPTLNLQFDKAKNDSDMLSLLKSQGGTFTRGSEVVGSGDSVASYNDALGTVRYAKLGHPRPNFVDGVNQGLLIEEERTNLLERSEEFDNAYWDKNGTTFTPDDTISPSGLLAGKLTRDVTTFSSVRATSVSTTLGVTYVFSAFYKKNTESTILHSILNEGTGHITFNFDTESISITRNDSGDTISTDGFGFEKCLNGWYRVFLKFVRKGGSFQAQVARQDTGVVGQPTYIWGAQLEAGSFATTYIPTAGTTVTRGAEVAKNDTTFDEQFNQNEGTFYGRFVFLNQETNQYVNIVAALRVFSRGIFVNASQLTNRLAITIRNDDGLNDLSHSKVLTNGATVGFSASYDKKAELIKISVNGAGVESLSATRFDVPNQFNFSNLVSQGTAPAENKYLNAPKPSIGYYPKALPEAQLELLSRI